MTMIVTNRKTTTGLIHTASSNQSAAQPGAGKSLPQGRRKSFFFGLFSSSEKPVPQRASTGTKLTKAQSPSVSSRITTISPELLRDPAFSSDPNSHLDNVGRPGRHSPTSVNHSPREQAVSPGDDSRRIWKPSLSPAQPPQTATPEPLHSLLSNSATSHPSSSGLSSSMSTETQPTSSSSEEHRTPTRNDSLPLPDLQPQHNLRIANPDPDEPPPYESLGQLRPSDKKVIPKSPAEPDASSSARPPTPNDDSGRSVADPPSLNFLKPSAPVVDIQLFPSSKPPTQAYPSQPLPHQRTPPLDTSNSPPRQQQSGPAVVPFRPVVLAYKPPSESQATGTRMPDLPSSSTGKSSSSHHRHHGPTPQQAKKPSSASRPPHHKGVDIIDELDKTNPLGVSFHNGGPYEGISKVTKSQPEQRNRPHREHTNAHLNQASSPIPFGGSLNLVPGQVLPRNFQPYSQPEPYQQSIPPLHRHPSSFQSNFSQSPMQSHERLPPFNAQARHVHAPPRTTPVPPLPHAHNHTSHNHITNSNFAQRPPGAAEPRSYDTPSDVSAYDSTDVDDSDAYGGIMNEEDATKHIIRNSAPLPSPRPTQSSPDLNLQRSMTSSTPRNSYRPLLNHSHSSLVRNDGAQPARHPTMGAQPNANGWHPHNNGYDTPNGNYLHSQPQQYFGPSQGSRHGPSSQLSIASSASHPNALQPRHIPKNLVMPTPLQSPPRAGGPNSPPPAHYVDPRHNMQSSYGNSPAPRAQLPRQPQNHTPMNMPPPPVTNHAGRLQKRSSMTHVRGQASVSFAAEYVQPSPSVTKKPPKRVLSKKRTDF